MAQTTTRELLVQVVEEADYKDFGFLVLRTFHGDNPLWEQWNEKFGDAIEKSVTSRGPAMDKMLDRLMTAMVDDGALHNANWAKIQDFFEEAQDDNMVPPGLDVGFCIAIDKAAMESLVAPEEGGVAWVWAVDTEFDFEAEREEGEGEAYPGFFKVAVEELVTEFFPIVAKETLSGPELWAQAKPVWKRAV